MELKEEYRPRERALIYGIKTLRNDELIAIMLRSGTKGKNAIDLANDILDLRSNLSELTNISIEELLNIKGIKNAKALEILACFELCKRINTPNMKEKISITHPKHIVQWLNNKIGYSEQEHFLVLFLNNHKEIISYKDMYVGLSDSCNISVKEVYTHALRINACFIIIVHNHPSGYVEPSQDDINVTENFVNVGKMCGISCIDHIIVGHNHYFSFREKQMIAS